MARRFRHEYGAGPLHLVAVAASFSLAGWALVQIFDTPNAVNVAIWLFGAVIAHDLVLLPLYSLLASIAYRGLASGRYDPLRISSLNHLRVPAVLAGTLFLVWFPEILGLADPRFQHDTGTTTGVYLGRWLALTGAMFALSAVAFAVRVRRARGR